MANPTQTSKLSAEERKVLRLVRQGCRDSEIAANLSLSMPRVHTLLEKVSTKLEARDRLELAMLAARMDS
jgi:DNA-binding NarL/FixJ family response regulator